VRRNLARVGAREHQLVLRLGAEWLVRRSRLLWPLAERSSPPEGGVAGTVDANAVLELLAVEPSRP
jgi:hypothetical protein